MNAAEFFQKTADPAASAGMVAADASPRVCANPAGPANPPPAPPLPPGETAPMTPRPTTLPLLTLAAASLAAPSAFAQFDFFVADDSSNEIRDSSGNNLLVAPPADRLRDVDALGSTLYYNDEAADAFFALPTAGGTATPVLDYSSGTDQRIVTGFSIADDGQTFYFGELITKAIYRGTLGGAITPIVDLEAEFGSGTYNPRGAALDEVNGKFYWSDPLTDSVYSANLDGSDAAALFTTATPDNTNTAPNAVAVDPTGGKLYVVDNDDFISQADLDGSNYEVLVNLDDSGFLGGQTTWSPEDVEFFSGRLYVADTSNGVFSIDTDGGAFRQNLADGDQTLRGVAVVPEPATAAVLGLAGLALAGRRRARVA